MELGHCRCPPLLNAAQMGDKRRRPILPTKRDTAEISTGRRKRRKRRRGKKGGKKQKMNARTREKERGKKGSRYREVGKSISRGPTSEQELRDCGKASNTPSFVTRASARRVSVWWNEVDCWPGRVNYGVTEIAREYEEGIRVADNEVFLKLFFPSRLKLFEIFVFLCLWFGFN